MYPPSDVLRRYATDCREVLRAFHRDEAFLFLGSAFTTVGIVAIAFCSLRRRFDALLVYLAIFAILYGQRLWLQAGCSSCCCRTWSCSRV